MLAKIKNPFGSHFYQKSMPKMKPKNDESKIVFWLIFDRFWGDFLIHFGDTSTKTANG